MVVNLLQRNEIMSTLRLPIETAQLSLRPIELRDVEAVARYHLLPNVQRYMIRQARDHIEVAEAVEHMRGQVQLNRPGETLVLAIEREGDKRVVGQIALTWSDATAGQGELRFAIDPAMAGNGYLTQAISAMLDLAFGHFAMHRITVRCDGRSHHTNALMQKLGFRLEAHYREHALFRGEWDEELHFALLDREWQRGSKVRMFPLQGRVA